MMAKPKNFNINARTIVAPFAALTMASLLFVYSRTSIQHAKRNAKLHREADGGQISWQNENRRSHGMKERPEDDRGLLEKIVGSGDTAPKGGKGEVAAKGSFEKELLKARAKKARE